MLPEQVETLRRLLLSPDETNAQLDGIAVLTMTPTFTYGQNTVGLAWHQYQAGQWELWQHAGGTGGYRSFMLCCPKAKIALVLLTNACIEVSPYGLNLFGKLVGN